MKIEDILKEFPYGIVVLKDDVPIHFVGYPESPSNEDLEHLAEELVEDETLYVGLQPEDKIDMVEVVGDEWEEVLTIFLE